MVGQVDDYREIEVVPQAVVWPYVLPPEVLLPPGQAERPFVVGTESDL